MKLGTIVPVSYFISAAIIMIGAYRKIVHAPDADTWLAVGMIGFALFIATAIYEILRSPRIQFSEKVMWTVSLILFSGIAGLIYVFMGRKRVAVA
jgi:hypothetical protein